MKKDTTLAFVITGHVDHGKSTLIGRILYDTKSLPKDRIRDVLGASLEKDVFAHFLDCFREEREKDMTVDTTQVSFRTKRRTYTIIDAPGHREFIKSMITGASYARIGVLVVDVNEGLKEQTRRHASILSFLGIRKVIVAINKMDTVNYEKDRFSLLQKETERLLSRVGLKAHLFIPISALKGENILKRSKRCRWYKGPSLIEAVDSMDISPRVDPQNFVMCVQDNYRIDGKDIVVGRVDSGVIRKGRDVRILPGKGNGKVISIERFLERRDDAGTGESIGLDLAARHPPKRGDILCDAAGRPGLRRRFEADILLFDRDITVGERLALRCSTQEMRASIGKIFNRFDSSTLEELGKSPRLRCLDMARVIIKTERPVLVRRFCEDENLGRFVLEKDSVIAACGIVVK
ncbi:MAG: GTP-binding protein [Candidatus Omnitrophota bacterium]